MYIVFGLLSALFAALVTVLGKLGLKNVDPVFATSVRAVIMAIFFVLMTGALQKIPKGGLQTLHSQDWLLLLGAGIAGALSWLFYFQALKMGDASRVASLDRLSLVFIAILSFLFLGESFSVKAVGGIMLMIIGVLLITT
jgi:transporter family protein